MDPIIIDAITPLVEAFKTTPDTELEGSIGVFGPTGYVPGVPFDYFERLYKTCDPTSSVWSRVDEKVPIVTYLFPDDIRARSIASKSLTYVRKRRLKRVDLTVARRPLDLRITLSTETPLQYCDAKWTQVRLHERWTLYYKNTWRFDFTKVVSGSCKEAACRSSPLFEIEVELLRTTETVDTPASRLAESLYLKLLDLLGRYDCTGTAIPFDCRLKREWTRATGQR